MFDSPFGTKEEEFVSGIQSCDTILSSNLSNLSASFFSDSALNRIFSTSFAALLMLLDFGLLTLVSVEHLHQAKEWKDILSVPSFEEKVGAKQRVSEEWEEEEGNEDYRRDLIDKTEAANENITEKSSSKTSRRSTSKHLPFSSRPVVALSYPHLESQLFLCHFLVCCKFISLCLSVITLLAHFSPFATLFGSDSVSSLTSSTFSFYSQFLQRMYQFLLLPHHPLCGPALLMTSVFMARLTKETGKEEERERESEEVNELSCENDESKAEKTLSEKQEMLKKMVQLSDSIVKCTWPELNDSASNASEDALTLKKSSLSFSPSSLLLSASASASSSSSSFFLEVFPHIISALTSVSVQKYASNLSSSRSPMMYTASPPSPSFSSSSYQYLQKSSDSSDPSDMAFVTVLQTEQKKLSFFQIPNKKQTKQNFILPSSSPQMASLPLTSAFGSLNKSMSASNTSNWGASVNECLSGEEWPADEIPRALRKHHHRHVHSSSCSSLFRPIEILNIFEDGEDIKEEEEKREAKRLHENERRIIAGRKQRERRRRRRERLTGKKKKGNEGEEKNEIEKMDDKELKERVNLSISFFQDVADEVSKMENVLNYTKRNKNTFIGCGRERTDEPRILDDNKYSQDNISVPSLKSDILQNSLKEFANQRKEKNVKGDRENKGIVAEYDEETEKDVERMLNETEWVSEVDDNWHMYSLSECECIPLKMERKRVKNRTSKRTSKKRKGERNESKTVEDSFSVRSSSNSQASQSEDSEQMNSSSPSSSSSESTFVSASFQRQRRFLPKYESNKEEKEAHRHHSHKHLLHLHRLHPSSSSASSSNSHSNNSQPLFPPSSSSSPNPPPYHTSSMHSSAFPSSASSLSSPSLRSPSSSPTNLKAITTLSAESTEEQSVSLPSSTRSTPSPSFRSVALKQPTSGFMVVDKEMSLMENEKEAEKDKEDGRKTPTTSHVSFALEPKSVGAKDKKMKLSEFITRRHNSPSPSPSPPPPPLMPLSAQVSPQKQEFERKVVKEELEKSEEEGSFHRGGNEDDEIEDQDGEYQPSFASLPFHLYSLFMKSPDFPTISTIWWRKREIQQFILYSFAHQQLLLSASYISFSQLHSGDKRNKDEKKDSIQEKEDMPSKEEKCNIDSLKIDLMRQSDPSILLAFRSSLSYLIQIASSVLLTTANSLRTNAFVESPTHLSLLERSLRSSRLSISVLFHLSSHRHFSSSSFRAASFLQDFVWSRLEIVLRQIINRFSSTYVLQFPPEAIRCLLRFLLFSLGRLDSLKGSSVCKDNCNVICSCSNADTFSSFASGKLQPFASSLLSLLYGFSSIKNSSIISSSDFSFIFLLLIRRVSRLLGKIVCGKEKDVEFDV